MQHRFLLKFQIILKTVSYFRRLTEKSIKFDFEKDFSCSFTAAVTLDSMQGEKELLDAAKKGEARRVKYYIEDGVDINCRDTETQVTPLIAAVDKGQTETVKLLLENRANVYLVDYYGWTPLFYAVDRGNLEIVRLLLEKNSDVNTKDQDRTTPLMKAAIKGFTEIAELLVRNKPDLNAKDKDGETALIHASAKGHLDIVRLLVENNADINAENKNHNTALIYANYKKFTEIADYLKSKGSK